MSEETSMRYVWQCDAKCDKECDTNPSPPQVFESTLQKYSDTLLGSEELNEYYDQDSGEHIIDTDPQIFYTILHFYQTKGHLYCPPSITEERFLEEVQSTTLWKLGLS